MQTLDYAKDPRAVLALARHRVEENREVKAVVLGILDAVEREGDEAVTTYTRTLDCWLIDSLGLRVSDREIDQAYRAVKKEYLRSIRIAKRNIEQFHRRQLLKTWTITTGGLKLEQRIRPLRRVGIYIPGGKAAYPSTVLMNAVPASVAGVREVVMVSPCSKEGKIAPEVLVAAAECGVKEIYRIGGAQAIAALAFGTESISRVDKITGPGNAYVAAAKQMVYGRVGIDMIAGPTEVVVIADQSARADFVAADLIAQAEHDEAATPICITSSSSLAVRIGEEIARQIATAPRRAIAQRAFDDHGILIIVRNIHQAVDIIDAFAPEHVEIMARDAARIAGLITNAGAIFVGEWSGEALGDYAAGPNHTLPTQGSARFGSPLSVLDFMKFSNVITCSRKSFLELAPHVELLAEAEGLHGHAASVRIRREAE